MNNQSQITKRQDILPAGHPDPMLMPLSELQAACSMASGRLNAFLHGVLYARAAGLCTGLSLAK